MTRIFDVSRSYPFRPLSMTLADATRTEAADASPCRRNTACADRRRIPAGALLVGLGSRLAMLVLRITSPDSVHRER